MLFPSSNIRKFSKLAKLSTFCILLLFKYNDSISEYSVLKFTSEILLLFNDSSLKFEQNAINCKFSILLLSKYNVDKLGNISKPDIFVIPLLFKFK